MRNTSAVTYKSFIFAKKQFVMENQLHITGIANPHTRHQRIANPLGRGIGLVIHWLPENFKRRYRIWFAKMPIPLMIVVCAIIVFVIYQFITADLQSFIYFQL